jgi:hypothetical protein
VLAQALALSVDLISNDARFVTEDGTYRQWILTEVYCLGAVESIFATCGHIILNLLLRSMSNDTTYTMSRTKIR